MNIGRYADMAFDPELFVEVYLFSLCLVEFPSCSLVSTYNTPQLCGQTHDVQLQTIVLASTSNITNSETGYYLTCIT